MQSNSTRETLLPFTKLVLGVSAVTQIVFAILGLFLLPLWNSLVWASPLPPYPVEIARFDFLNYVATGAASAFALYLGKWSGARVYFVFGFLYNLLSILVVIITAMNPGVPPIMWLLVLLGVIYLPVVIYVWRTQEQMQA